MPLPNRANSLYDFMDNLPRVFTSNWKADHSGIRNSGIAAVSGEVSVKSLSSESSVPLTTDYMPSQGDIIVSSGDGSAVLNLDSDKEIFIDANTVLELADVKIDSKTNGYVTRLKLHEGNVLSSVHQPLGEHDIYEVRTPMLDMAIRGTTVHVGYDKPSENSTVAFLTGRGLIKSKDTGEVIDLFAGEQIVLSVDGYVKGDVDRDLLPTYIAKSLSNFNEIMYNIDTIDYRAASPASDFNAENYIFEQEDVDVDDTEAIEETQKPLIETLLENVRYDFSGGYENSDNGKLEPEPKIPDDGKPESEPELPDDGKPEPEPELPGDGKLEPESNPPVISEAVLPGATVNVPYSVQLTATNNPKRWTSSGNLPDGLSLDKSNGVISGTPTRKSEFGFTVTATNGDGVSQPVRFKIAVNDVPIFAISASSSLDFGSVNTGYAQPAVKTVTITNTGNMSIDLLQPEASDNYDIGRLSNTTLGINEEATFTVQPKAGLGAEIYDEKIIIYGSNGVRVEVDVSFTVTKVVPIITTQSGALSKGTVGSPYSVTLAATNYPTSWASSGNLPDGLSLSDKGIISGTPTKADTFSFSVTAKNGDGISQAVAFSIIIEDAAPVNDFVAVTSITGVPTEIWFGQSLALSGVVNPSHATNQAIKWSYIGATANAKAEVTDNTLTITSLGSQGKATITILATIENGAGFDADYTQEFKIDVVTAPLLCSECGKSDCDGDCVCSECGKVDCDGDCVCGFCGRVDCEGDCVCSVCGKAECTNDCTCSECDKTTNDGYYTVYIQIVGKGTVTINSKDIMEYRAAKGEEIKLGNKSNNDYKFEKWEDIEGNVTIPNNGKFVMPDRDVTILVTFVLKNGATQTFLTIQTDNNDADDTDDTEEDSDDTDEDSEDSSATEESDEPANLDEPTEPIDIIKEDKGDEDDTGDTDDTGEDGEAEEDKHVTPIIDDIEYPVSDVSEPESQE